MSRFTAASRPDWRAGLPDQALTLVNQTTDEPIATQVEVARTRRERRRGLLGRDGLEPGAALILIPCVAVHTAFMRFAIDVLFVNRAGVAIHLVERLQPWRMAMAPGAHAVIELPAGALARHDVRVGDRVQFFTAGRGSSQQFDFQQVDECLALRAS